MSEIEEQWLTRILQEAGSKGTFYDVGAYHGHFTVLALSINPALEIHAFEPVQEYREELMRRVGKRASLTLHSEAVASGAGRSRFVIEEQLSGLAKGRAQLGRPGLRPWLGRQKERFLESPKLITLQVETTTLDTAISTPVLLVKVDVQGSEAEVLLGATRVLTEGSVRHWLLSTHSEKLHKRCLDHFQRFGYEVVLQLPKPNGPSDGLIVASKL